MHSLSFWLFASTLACVSSILYVEGSATGSKPCGCPNMAKLKPPNHTTCDTNCANFNNFLLYLDDGRVTKKFRGTGLGGIWIDVPQPSDNYTSNAIDNGTSKKLKVKDAVLGFCIFCSILDININDTGAYTLLVKNGTATKQCPSDATGFLCSKCANGTYHNMGRRCVKCNNRALHWFLFILAEFVPITLVFLALLLTNLSLVSGPLNASIFFAQTITTTMDLTGDGFIPLTNITNSSKVTYALKAAYSLVYQPFNLNFAYPFTNELCLLTYPFYLPYLVIQYVVALYPLLLLLLLLLIQFILKKEFKFIQLVKEDSSRQNIFASIILLSYAKFTLVSAYIIAPNPLYNQYGTHVKSVLIYDPTFEFFDKDHAAYAAIAIMVYIFAVLLPLFLFILRHSKSPKNQRGIQEDDDTVPPNSDVETKSEKIIATIIKPFHVDFKETCQHPICCAKSKRWRSLACGIHGDHLGMPGFYFLLRILLLVIFILAPNFFRFIVQFILQQLVCIIVAAVVFVLQPYKRQWVNNLDGIVFLLLAFINTVSIYQYFLTISGQSLSTLAFAVQYILIFLPSIWMTLYITYHVYTFCKRKRISRPAELVASSTKYHTFTNGAADKDK